jgi:hypothetical protein
VQEIAAEGDTELECCRALLQGFAAFLRQKADPASARRSSS